MNRPKTVSMQDIADAVGVSRATVSNALRGKGRLSPETAKAIHEAAKRLNFVPSNLGRALRTGSSRTIGLVIPDFRMPLFAEFARAFALAAQEREMVLTVADSMGCHERQAAHLAEMSARGVEMTLVIPMRGTPVEALPQTENVLVIDAENNPHNALSSDHFGGGLMMAEHLAALGHREILLIDSDHKHDPRGASRVNDLRRSGFEAGFARHGIRHQLLSIPARFDQICAHMADYDLRGVTAIAATYDVLALGALHMLLARGFKVPHEIAVTGFDDTVWGQIIHPPLTTIRQDLSGLAQAAFDIAMGERERGLTLPVTLVERASSAPPPSSGKPQ